MNNIKPIFCIGLSIDVDDAYLYEVNSQVAEYLKNDYYILIYKCNTDNPIFNVFYDKDYDEKNIEEVKEFINQKLKEINIKLI